MKLSMIFSFFILLMHASFAQIKIAKVEKKEIPASIKYAGHIINAVKYADNNGDQLVITTETGLTPNKEDEPGNSRDAALYAYHYNIKGPYDYKLTWQTYDFIKGCQVDLEAQYVPNTFAVTDLNKDGNAEVWLMYTTTCQGDVSPQDMKIIMHQGDKKYAVRGTKKVKISETQFAGGSYTFDDAFKSGPEVFRQYAAGIWKKNLLKVWK